MARIIEDLNIDNLKIIQDDGLYKFTSDAVILSKFAKLKKNDIVADFCSGSGIVGIHAYALNKNIKSLHLFELQTELYSMSLDSISINNLQNKVTAHNIKLQDIDKSFNDFFSVILCNPPYKKPNSGEHNLSYHIAVCRHEIELSLDELVAVASLKLRVGGRFVMCQKIERLTDIICLFRKNKLEPSRIQFIATSTNKEPYLVLIEGVKCRTPQLKILPTYINN